LRFAARPALRNESNLWYAANVQRAALGEPSSSVDDDTRRFAGMRPERRLALFLELCDLTDAIQAGRPNREALRAPQSRSEEALALWGRLMGGARGR
jgi:hypothetical protein